MSENIKNTEHSAQQIIEQYSKKGYLFHGSPNGEIEELAPRTAIDTDKTNTFNNDTAIFASDNACSTIIFAVVSRDYLPDELKNYAWSFDWIRDIHGNISVRAKINIDWKPYIEKNGKGFVYVLPSETFLESGGCQFKSKVAVKPFDKVEVTLKDYFDMGGEIIWTEETHWN